MSGARQIGGSLASFKTRFPVSPILRNHDMFGTLGFCIEVIIMDAPFCFIKKTHVKPPGGGTHL